MSTVWPSLVLIAAGCLLGVRSLSGATGLAYCRYESGYWQVWLAPLADPHHRSLTRSPFDKRCLKPVPAAPQLIFRDNDGKLHKLRVPTGVDAGGLLDRIEVVKDFDVSPARGYLVSTYAPNAIDNIRIWWYSTDEQQKRLLIGDPKLNEMPRWIAGSGMFLFVKATQGTTRVFRAAWDTPQPLPLFPDLAESTTDPAPSPDGRLLAYCQAGPNAMDLWLAQTDGAKPRRLYAGPGLEAEPCWDPEGQTVYFTTWDGTNFRVASIRLEGGDVRLLTPPGVDCRYPAVVNLESP